MLWLVTIAVAGDAPAVAPKAELAQLVGVDVEYHVAWDMQGRGDDLCKVTGLCDCKGVYRGSGNAIEVAGNRVTFEGTWALIANSCADHFTIWRPEAGTTAFHTVRFDEGSTAIVEWIVHRDRDKVDPIPSNIKEQGQFWINGMQASWTPEGKVEHHEVENGSMQLFTVQTTHDLKLTFHGPS